jgi:hypothetical protein
LSSSSFSPSTPRSLSPRTGDDAENPIVVDEDTPNWPWDFYAADIDLGFAYCDAARRAKRGVPKAFEEYFGVAFVNATFYRHRQKWDKAGKDVRRQMIHAGRTPEGKWSEFLALVSQPKKSRNQAKKMRR